ncbi:MAG: phosphatase PAP2 family protein [Chloroflexi bacterium]|nr:MAG: phosphatase PAP2 family protein [Chloroflexota bacterium]
MSAQPKEAAKEILAGEPQEAARSWLGWTALAMFVLFGIDTVLVLDGFWLPIDVRITTFIQGLNWGPIVYPMELINVTAGYWQVLTGIIAIVALFVVERRAGWLMLIGSVSSLLDNIIKLLVSRQRPTVDLVHILTPASGFSYPSGHAVFFTWMSFMLAVSLAPRIKPVYRPAIWLVATTVIVLTCIARVWAGDHWPSDVIGGVLLGAGWSALVLWLPERWLPSPSFRWFSGRLRRRSPSH